MLNSDIISRITSAYIVLAMLTAAFIGILVYEGVVDEGGAEAAKTLIVDSKGGGDHTTIQDAVNAAQAGDTIKVWAGNYKESITVSKKVELIGNGSANTTIQGSGVYGIWIEADWVNVSGFNITNHSNWGIYTDNVKNVHIYDNNCSFNDYGIYISDSGNITIENNTIYKNDATGIQVYYSNKVTIINNNLSDNQYGISALYSTNSTIRNNTIFRSQYSGITVYYSIFSIIDDNTCNYNSGAGISIYQAQNSSLNNNVIMNNDVGIYISYSSNNTIMNSTFVGNDRSGIDFYYTRNNTIENNNASYNGWDGIYIRSSKNSTLINNTVNWNVGTGIYFHDSQWDRVIRNNCSYNDYGFHCRESNSIFILNNTFNSNFDDGINILESSLITIIKNSLNFNDGGIFLKESNSSVIQNNSINQTKDQGIYIYISENITVYNNSMISSGIYVLGHRLSYWNSHTISTNNTVNNKPVYYWKDQNGGTIPAGAGQVILANCTNVIVENQNCSNTNIGILMGFSNNNSIRNNSLNYNEGGIFTRYSHSNYFINNTIENNSYGGMLLLYSDSNTITDNTIKSNYFMGIYIGASSGANVTNNTLVSCGIIVYGLNKSQMTSQEIDVNNTVNGKPVYYWKNVTGGSVPAGAGQVILVNCTKVAVNNQNCSNATVGIAVTYSNNITIENNTCNFDRMDGIQVMGSEHMVIRNNTCSDGTYGLTLLGIKYSVIENITVSKMEYGFYISPSYQSIFKNISVSDCNEGFEVNYSDHNTFFNVSCSNNTYGFLIYGSSSNTIKNSNLFNNSFGFHLNWSSNHVIENSTVESNSKFDIYIIYCDENNTVINSTFNTLDFYDSKSYLIIQNYLHIQVNDTGGSVVPNVDVMVMDDANTTYASSGYGGSDAQTDSGGQVKWILVTDRLIDNKGNVIENKTAVSVKLGSNTVRDNDRDINMSTSHFEYFDMNALPGKVSLVSPANNTYNNDSTPKLTWSAASDLNGDPLSYYVQVDEWGGDWTSLAASNHTSLGILSWDVSTTLSDDQSYQWRIRANDGLDNGSWSDVRKFTVDTSYPIPNRPDAPGLFNNTGTVKWTWQAAPDTGSGITGYYVYLGTTMFGSDVVNGALTVNTWYEQSGLLDGNTYYCRIKAKNGAGMTGGYSSSSTGIEIDLDIPIAYKPVIKIKYNNTGSVKWTWPESADTGSGIYAYYAFVGTAPDKSDVMNGFWTFSNSYEIFELKDGETYYCRIKVKNYAGTTSDYSPSSDGVIVDLDKPVAPKPIPTSKYNNTGTVKWSWPSAIDTGSDILGYYVTIIWGPEKNIFVSDAWTNNTWFEYSGLIDPYNWYCRIKVKNGAGTIGEYGNDSEGVIVDLTSPSKPRKLTETPGDWTSKNSFYLSWTNPSDFSGIAGVYYKIGNVPASNSDGTLISIDGIDNLKDISVGTDGEYRIYVWLVDNAGNVNSNNHAVATLYYDSTEPKAPTGVTVTPSYWTSTNSFSIDWTDPTDLSGIKTGAYYYIGNSPPDTQADGTWISEKPFVITTAPEGESTLYLWLKDNAGNNNYLNYAQTILKLDTTPPSITFTPVTSAKIGEDVTITTIVTDGASGVDKCYLYYKLPTDGSYIEIEMENSDTLYSAVIPGNAVTEEGLEYYIKALDLSSPANVIFNGEKGETGIEPDASNDIDILMPETILDKLEITNYGPKGIDAPITGLIYIVFNKSMDEDSAEKAFSTSPSVSGTFEWYGNRMSFTPDVSMDPETEYTVILTENASDSDGFGLRDGFQWTFTTEKGEDIKDGEGGEGKEVEDNTLVYGIAGAVVAIVIILLIILLFFKDKLRFKGKKPPEEKEPEQKPDASSPPTVPTPVQNSQTPPTKQTQPTYEDLYGPK
jgi:parallel beta-helix repeat protein